MRIPSIWNGRTFCFETTCKLETDASGTGWGGVLFPKTLPSTPPLVSRDWKGKGIESLHQTKPSFLIAKGLWDAALTVQSINVKELRAIYLAVLAFHQELRNETVEIHTDSRVAYHLLKSTYSRVPGLRHQLGLLISAFETYNIKWRMAWLATEENVRADTLSRIHEAGDYMLDPRHFKKICKIFRVQPTIDRFAAFHNRQLLRYNSQYHDPMAEGQDAFQQGFLSWATEVNYVHPPVGLMSKTIRFIQEFPHITAIIIAPVMPAQEWYRSLQEMAIQQFTLPRVPPPIIQGRFSPTSRHQATWQWAATLIHR
ncbi:MAG: hypothetical protein Aurels2KO_57340 [Aureliella sp.]